MAVSGSDKADNWQKTARDNDGCYDGKQVCDENSGKMGAMSTEVTGCVTEIR